MKTTTMRWLGPTALAAGLSVLGAGCNPTDRICNQVADCPPEPPIKIVVTPPDVLKEVDIDHQESHSICYRARAIYKDGTGADITNAALWTLDRPVVGSFQKNCLATATNLNAGGIVKVRANLTGSTGDTSLIIKLRGFYEGDGVSAADFGGPPASDAKVKPGLVYPLNDSIHARNITQMNIQFFAGLGNQVFRARFTSPQMDYVAYFKPTKCSGDRCQWQVPDALWARIALTNGGTSARLVISGAAGGGASAVAQSDAVQLTFSPEDVKGGLFYFSTSLPGIMRAVFDARAATKATPFIAPNSAANPKDCVGCHAVSKCDLEAKVPRPSKITATYGHGDDFLGIASAVDPTKFSMTPATTRSNFQWFNPDGTRVISNFNGELIVRDGETGAEVGRVPKNAIGPDGKQRAAMPEWSHDGRRVVFVRLGPSSGTIYDASDLAKREGGDWALVDAGEITTLSYDAGSFGDVSVVVPLGEGKDFHYYPTFSPDDAWIVFNSGSKPGFSPVAQGPMGYGVPADKLVSYDQKTSRLRMVRTSGGGVIDLVRATVAPGTTASWPKFTPFVQRGSKLLFFTYSSKMDYGFTVTGGLQPQLWMSAVDLGKLGESSSDPSYAPAWLPFQDERESNHLGVWSTCTGCATDKDCGDEFLCLNGRCGCDPDTGCKPRM